MTMTMRRLAFGFGVLGLASLGVTDASAAAPRHAAHRAPAKGRARKVARTARPAAEGSGAFGTTVYGASAPYYIFGPGGGDAYGDDPIGGPEHVGDGGPGANF